MRNWLKVFLMAALSLMIAVGCSTQAPGSNQQSEGNNEAPAQDESIKIGFSISTLNNPFFVSLKEGAEAEAEKQGVEITTVDAQNDPAKQTSDIEDLIQQGVDVLVINPTDSAAIVAAIESANSAGIPVITVDRSADGGEVVSHIASDNVAGGKMAGEFILEKLGNKGKIVELEGIPGSSAARERGEGFHSAVDGVEGIEVVAKQAADFDRAKGLTVMENILQSNKDIQAVFAHNDEMALGALEALKAAGVENVLVVGFDATEDAVKAVEDGRMAATVAQKPALIGEKGVATAVSVVKGEQVEPFIPVDLELVKK
ncbi:ribose ABC transporter substrate-binding protein RbsB [Calidifontibacillus erzurumensis]|uniref:Ribose import binding protein RbsB n=1 Tax=Calidifontibacillus erzurumensis TaxID=2741433 RepID=A0A8J8KBA0_9BACI|nr:ribose ABC transporter substrate-binding protein RbsB [Calidifontibacillus erzurumensis]NSL51427.1 ribose ABC transporter substrate-binding protein RbsB [Calidifontibacillus erzurumensis]